MILFLDFDGVLHPISSRLVRREAGTLVIDQDPEGEPLFCRVPLLAAVLRDFPEVRIVLSTSWTRYVPKAALLEPLEDLADRVIGSLSPFERGTRYERVRTFLEPFQGEPWIALEDDRRNYPETAPVLWTDSATGLTVQGLGTVRKRLTVARVLDDFSDLKISRNEAMNTLGLRWYGDLLRLNAASGRRRREVHENEAASQTAEFVRVMKEHGR